jgi:cytochrome c peroxidase
MPPVYLFPHLRALTTCVAITLNAILVSSCGDGVLVAPNQSGPATGTGTSLIDTELRQRIQAAGVTGDVEAGRTLPAITDPVAQLGKDLFFTTGLGGNLEVSCVTCHHPNLGGGDDLSLSVGVGAVDPLVLGPGRVHEETGRPNVPRNAPSIFNIGLWDRSMFWDGRIENMDPNPQNNGLGAIIRTPDTAFGVQDIGTGGNLTSAQAHFPVTSAQEMRTASFAVGADNETLRERLAARIGNYGEGAGELAQNDWLQRFRTAYDQPAALATDLIHYDNIAIALAEYERSMVFTDNPFNRWVAGNEEALTEEQKRGALLFYTRIEDNGAGCSSCHTGDFFTDELMHNVATIQVGAGKGNGNADDFGRERETGLVEDRYKFRTPTLLNVAVTGPYGHAGAFDTLEQMVAHYINPGASVNDWFNRGGACGVEQFGTIADCATLYPEARTNSVLSLQQLQISRANGDSLFLDANLTAVQQAEIVSFLEALTDPCVEDPMCMRPWVADPTSTGSDGMQLNGVDWTGTPLGR